MKEIVLKQYFEDQVSVDDLAKDLKGTQRKNGFNTTGYFIESIDNGEEFLVQRKHLLKICNAAINGDLELTDIKTIGFAITGSDYFSWDFDSEDDEIICNVLNDWAVPEINFEINIENLKLWKEYIETGVRKLK